jgi:hypothetical protein
MADPVVPTPFATALEGLAWVCSSQQGKPVYGCAVIVLLWTAGRVRLPLGLRRWHKGGPATLAFAVEWRSYARHRRHGRPADGLFDAWSAAHALLKRIRADGWYLVCRLKQNRRLHGQPRRASRRRPYGAESGRLRGGRHVLVVRDGAKYDATTRLTLPAAEVRRL